MRWNPFGARRPKVEQDPGQQRAVLDDARQRFGGHVRVPFAEQAAELQRSLAGDDGLAVAAVIVNQLADAAQADLVAQVTELHRRTGHALSVDRRNYRPLWAAAGGHLRWSLFELPVGLHPYVHLVAAANVLDADAKRAVKVIDTQTVLARLLELLDLTLDGWEYGRVRVDTDAAGTAEALIFAARSLRDALGDPPPLPPPVREWMRRNTTVQVYDVSASRIVGSFTPGRTMRETLLV